ncbi:peptidyl-alpha-hydroxyglycine alpha-amidating lyase 1 isoform X2 [Orussus abietinus]|uniref:peptidyl-alpha-hydroxyglycine alpha-amidating lyase 1 isoform X2 n=1 Tax=Orussus abietinus TaxID=222816 RepID=UPI00062548A2|nr:peptidyl-alpha-hydroxyglycine alpha-amidating lyase 1 isoform X2 [Orussus abietinus]
MLNTAHQPPSTFQLNDYSDFRENDEGDRGRQFPQWSQVLQKNIPFQRIDRPTNQISVKIPDDLDPNILWDARWNVNYTFGQISAVSIDPDGNIAVFHRGDRIWNSESFNRENKFDPTNGPIKQNTIILLNKGGKKILEWGENLFYMPHGLTIDSFGNYWITDVALHQVLKYDADDIKKSVNRQTMSVLHTVGNSDEKGFHRNNDLKPSLVLGIAFEPGNDDQRFCKPTAVAIQRNGDFFVSDGYCNSRIIKFNKIGERILHWGRKWIGPDVRHRTPPHNTFFVPHALAVAEDLNYIFVADRENGRILCFFSNNGTFHKEYTHPVIGTKVYSISYALGKLYLVNGRDQFILNDVHVRGFSIDIDTGNIVSQFGPVGDMNTPHDIAASEDGLEVYVVELDAPRVYRFLQGSNDTISSSYFKNSTLPKQQSAPFNDRNTDDTFFISSHATTTTAILSLITSAMFLIAVCVTVAAIIARRRKRGCLLTVHRRMFQSPKKRENFKLSSLLDSRTKKNYKFLDNRPNTKQFKKLNTDPESSEDENHENNLTKLI